VQTASQPMVLSKNLDQYGSKQGSDHFRETMALNQDFAAHSVNPNPDVLVEINTVKLLVETLVARQVCASSGICTYPTT
jgi:hypothetical protein